MMLESPFASDWKVPIFWDDPSAASPRLFCTAQRRKLISTSAIWQCLWCNCALLSRWSRLELSVDTLLCPVNITSPVGRRSDSPTNAPTAVCSVEEAA